MRAEGIENSFTQISVSLRPTQADYMKRRLISCVRLLQLSIYILGSCLIVVESSVFIGVTNCIKSTPVIAFLEILCIKDQKKFNNASKHAWSIHFPQKFGLTFFPLRGHCWGRDQAVFLISFTSWKNAKSQESQKNNHGTERPHDIVPLFALITSQ